MPAAGGGADGQGQGGQRPTLAEAPESAPGSPLPGLKPAPKASTEAEMGPPTIGVEEAPKTQERGAKSEPLPKLLKGESEVHTERWAEAEPPAR